MVKEESESRDSENIQALEPVHWNLGDPFFLLKNKVQILFAGLWCRLKGNIIICHVICLTYSEKWTNSNYSYVFKCYDKDEKSLENKKDTVVLRIVCFR